MSVRMMCIQLSSDDSTEGDIVEAGVRIGDVYALLVGEYPQLELNTYAYWHKPLAHHCTFWLLLK